VGAHRVRAGRIFFNFNPLLKLDGYYLLSDWAEIPNLRPAKLGITRKGPPASACCGARTRAGAGRAQAGSCLTYGLTRLVLLADLLSPSVWRPMIRYLGGALGAW